MVKPKSWIDISSEEIGSSIDDMKAELFTLRCEYKFAKKIEKPHRIRALRRDLARALTEVQARRIANANALKKQV